MAVQTTYTKDYSVGIAGAAVDASACNVETVSVESAAGIAAGFAAARGTADGLVRVPEAGVVSFRGIMMRGMDMRAGTPNIWAQYDDAAIMTAGKIWVTAQAAVTRGQAAFFLIAGGGITNVDDATSEPIPNGVFETSAAQNALVELRFNL